MHIRLPTENTSGRDRPGDYRMEEMGCRSQTTAAVSAVPVAYIKPRQQLCSGSELSGVKGRKASLELSQHTPVKLRQL